MPLINPPSSPPSPTEAATANLRQRVTAHYLDSRQTYLYCRTQIFQRDGATPQEVVAALGADAAELFDLLSVLLARCQQVGATDLPPLVPDGWGYTANADGTITLAVPQNQG